MIETIQILKTILLILMIIVSLGFNTLTSLLLAEEIKNKSLSFYTILLTLATIIMNVATIIVWELFKLI